MYFSTAITLTALLLVRMVRIINWKIKALLRGGKEGEDNIDVLIRFISAHLTLLHLHKSTIRLTSFLKAQGRLV